MIAIDTELTPAQLRPRIERLFDLSGVKIRALHQVWTGSGAAPVITVRGVYASREWTEWTQGFMYGSALLQYEATGDRWYLEYGRRNTLRHMAPYLTHTGVHDHGFNIVSTYGNLLRLANEGKYPADDSEKNFLSLALQVSGAVQAARWTPIRDGRGYLHSFNGPHSLFVDTIRSLRSLALAYRLGHELRGEGGEQISLLQRLIHHASVTSEFAVFYGEGRDVYDVRGRVAHESIFNVKDGSYRCPSTQQGYSPFSTWTRGLAWAMCGFAEELEFIAALGDQELEPFGGRQKIEGMMMRAADATCDYYLAIAARDGIPFWDTGAPRLAELGDPLSKLSDPFNDVEPVDSSAAAIAAQGLYRFGNVLEKRGNAAEKGRQYRQAALTIAQTLFDEPYLSTEAHHHGLILHALYHRPKGWDYIPPGRKIPCGESSMWGDYHARELALLILREANGAPPLTFF
jgi:hypothetical protein